MTDIRGDASTTASISVGGSATSALEIEGDHDWFAINLSAGQTITVSLTGTGTDPVLDTLVNMVDSSGYVLASNDDINTGAGDYNSRLSFTAATAGTYYIDATSWSDPSQGYYGSTGRYELSVTTGTGLPVYTYDQIANQLVNGYWNSEGGSWRHFDVDQGDTLTVNLSALTAGGRYLAREALEIWSDTLGVGFTETTGSARISFDDNDTGAYSSSSTYGNIISSSSVNIEAGWLATYGTTLNSYSFQAYLHEIGHALGLGHAGDYNGGADYSSDAGYRNDAWSTTIMSYFSQQQNSYFSGQGFTYNYAVTPMLADVVAMATLYGTPTTTRTGDTIYGFNTNSGRDVFNASLNPDVAYTIVDSGGIDTLDYSEFGAKQRIDLNAETFSNVGDGDYGNGNVGNVSIARGTIIENAIGGRGDDTLIGNAGDNVLTGGAGGDSIDGGAGNDAASYAGATEAVVVDLNCGGPQNSRGAGYDTLTSIEGLIGSSYGDLLTGTSAANRLDGGDGNDVMYGNRGDDSLVGGEGNDRLDGGEGNDIVSGGAGVDTANYIHATSGVTLSLAVTTAQVTGGAGTDTVSGIERLVGSNYGDNFTGDGVANVIIGRNGNDLVSGGFGYDRLQGDGGDDIVNGGDGYDTMAGGSGDDVLNGDVGNDSLNGGDGNDQLNGGSGVDIASYSNAAAAVTVNLGLTGPQDTIAAGWDTLVGMERIFGSRFNDRLTGSGGNDTIQGAAGNDSISGGNGGDRLAGDAGNDLISGGGGVDRLYGGDGEDVFRFNTALNASTNWDYIVDFSRADDTVQLAQPIFSAIAGTGTLDVSEFRLGTGATDQSDHIIYDQSRGYIYYDEDGSGAGSQLLFARVAAGTELTNADFSVYSSAQQAASAVSAIDADKIPLFTDVVHSDGLFI